VIIVPILDAIFIFLGLVSIFGLIIVEEVELWMAVIWICGFGYYILRQMSIKSINGSKSSTERHSASGPSPHDIAQRALQRAGNSFPHAGTQLIDIGILAYDGDNQPKVSRTEAVPAYATQLRPFIMINHARTKNAYITVKFELIDATNQIRFAYSQRAKIVTGKNFLTSRTWLPMGDNESGGDWSLRISVSDHLLALHKFKITPDAGAAFRSYLRSDGEIDAWLAKSAEQSATERMSLDDLIGDQEDIDIDMFRESQAQRQIKERR
jgi:hypothetical protein